MTAALLKVPVEDGIYPDLPEEIYHSDPDSLSSSGARQLLKTSPRKFRLAQRVEKREWDVGHVVHKLILGKGSDVAVLDPAVHGLTRDGEPAKNPRSTAMWQAAEADARTRGAVPISISDYATAEGMAAAVWDNDYAADLLSVGEAEVSGYWTDPTTGARLRLRMDWMHPGRSRLIIVDYKTTKNAEPRAFWKSVSEYGYHQQDAWYRAGAVACGLCDDPLFVFIAQEKEFPYEVTVHESRPSDVNRGHALNRKAINLWAQCHQSNEWPGYPPGIHTIRHPSWAIHREQEQIAS
ncbi:PD-(D/E)XK nuclease-like domain-containing protein [Mycobacterium hackensackense]|uniref:PD-(D/E)XK nuclease-like domain-containing protein n=1 Tax=Mycobacterium hackensackense TaxID=228909 RepID=UPI002265F0A7|nr:PD-(D/E)XK nuclease-like domain-containing protein [Mycobacterium hackensackense]MCV7255269.1 PD-(D/E)XK nuclease-like domain-containing protein [Mycobacterium hackensackense]